MLHRRCRPLPKPHEGVVPSAAAAALPALASCLLFECGEALRSMPDVLRFDTCRPQPWAVTMEDRSMKSRYSVQQWCVAAAAALACTAAPALAQTPPARAAGEVKKETKQ